MKSLSRALTILAELGEHGGQPLSLADITDSVDLHKSTVHRMLATFIDHGLVRRDDANRYAVGMGVLELARAVGGRDASWDSILPSLRSLVESVRFPVAYAVPQAGRLVCGASERLPDVPPGVYRRGAHLPFHATAAGKAYLAFRPSQEIDRFVATAPLAAHTARTVTGVAELLRCLTRARRQGYALEDREYTAETRCIAAPVLDRSGLAVASVFLCVPPRALSREEGRRALVELQGCAEQISTSLFGAVADVEAPEDLVGARAVSG